MTTPIERVRRSWPPRVKFLVLVVAVVLGTGAVSAATFVARAGDEPRVGDPVAAGEPLIFDEEFDGAAGAPADPGEWSNQVGGNWNHGVDRQYYTPGTRNVSLTGRGTLLISARTENYSGWDADRSYTSARLTSSTAFHYGHIAARMRFDGSRGAFPAIWLLGSNYPQVGWPACGELDMVETTGGASRVSGGIHGPQIPSADRKSYFWQGGGHTAPSADWVKDWHVYAVDWTESSVTWSVDGEVFARVNRDDLAPDQTWTVDQPANLVVNVAVGGYAGRPAPGFAAAMEIDWIRVSR